MDKIPLLKQLLVQVFSEMVRKAQRGYPMDGYGTIREAMMAINTFDNFVVDPNKITAVVDHYLRELNNI